MAEKTFGNQAMNLARDIGETALGALIVGALVIGEITIMAISNYQTKKSKKALQKIGIPQEGAERYIGSRLDYAGAGDEAVLSAGDNNYLIETRVVKRGFLSQPVLRVVGRVVKQGEVYATSNTHRATEGFGPCAFYDYVKEPENQLPEIKKTLEEHCQPEIDKLFMEKHGFNLKGWRTEISY